MRQRALLTWLVISHILVSVAGAASASAQTLAHTTTPTGTVHELVIDKRDHAVLRTWTKGRAAPEELILATPAEVLPLFLDSRLQGIWPAILEWAGLGLEKQRARMLEESRAAFTHGKTAFPRIGLEQYVSGGTAALMQRARILALGGHGEEAKALLRAELARQPVKKSERQEQALSAEVFAEIVMAEGNISQAIQILGDAERALGEDPILLNLLVNHAAILAMEGQYTESLAIIDPAAEGFASHRKTLMGLLTSVPGSARHFAWIKACALAGLGRRAEAEIALQPLLTPREPVGLLLPPSGENTEVRLKAYACMHDKERMIQEMLGNIANDPVAPIALTWLQAEAAFLQVDPAFLRSVKDDPRVIIGTRDVFSPLPADLILAWSGWRQ